MAEVRKGRGCIFYGCVFFIIFTLCLAVGGYLVYNYVANQVVAKFTSPTPIRFPKTELTPGQWTDLQTRLQGLEAGSAQTLVLNENELNALMERDPKGAAWSSKVHFIIQSNLLKGQLSLPLDQIRLLPGARGRYFNGEGVFNVGLTNGELTVKASSLTVNGTVLPQKFMGIMATNNLAKDFKDPKTTEFLKRFESINIEDDKLILKALPQKQP